MEVQCFVNSYKQLKEIKNFIYCFTSIYSIFLYTNSLKFYPIKL
jgi:hypothetical protein